MKSEDDELVTEEEGVNEEVLGAAAVAVGSPRERLLCLAFVLPLGSEWLFGADELSVVEGVVFAAPKCLKILHSWRLNEISLT